MLLGRGGETDRETQNRKKSASYLVSGGIPGELKDLNCLRKGRLRETH